jgi:hypothetical protein
MLCASAVAAFTTRSYRLFGATSTGRWLRADVGEPPQKPRAESTELLFAAQPYPHLTPEQLEMIRASNLSLDRGDNHPSNHDGSQSACRCEPEHARYNRKATYNLGLQYQSRGYRCSCVPQRALVYVSTHDTRHLYSSSRTCWDMAQYE